MTLTDREHAAVTVLNMIVRVAESMNCDRVHVLEIANRLDKDNHEIVGEWIDAAIACGIATAIGDEISVSPSGQIFLAYSAQAINSNELFFENARSRDAIAPILAAIAAEGLFSSKPSLANAKQANCIQSVASPTSERKNHWSISGVLGGVTVVSGLIFLANHYIHGEQPATYHARELDLPILEQSTDTSYPQRLVDFDDSDNRYEHLVAVGTEYKRGFEKSKPPNPVIIGGSNSIDETLRSSGLLGSTSSQLVADRPEFQSSFEERRPPNSMTEYKNGFEESRPPNSIIVGGSNSINDTLRPNAYGPGINANQYGQAVTVRPDFGGVAGQQLQLNQNAYGPGVHADQFGRPVREYPLGQ